MIRVYRDVTKEAIGLSVFEMVVTGGGVTDSGAVAEAAPLYYVIRGLSACTLTPGL